LQNEEVLPLIRADAQHLRRVFTNLIDNALKYSDEGTTVAVSTHETPTHVIVKVSDEGHGMPEEELPFVFDAFHRGVGTQKKGGFGLGLAGVKAIVDAHGGRVRVKSEPGEGSTFIVTLPKTGHEQGREEGDI
jgi:signal transduction histidine kinase